MSDVVVSLLTALAGGIPAVIAVVLSNRSHDKVVDERMKNTNEKIDNLAVNTSEKIESLAAKVEKHNNLVERMVIVEQSTKSAHHRIDDITSQLKITERRK